MSDEPRNLPAVVDAAAPVTTPKLQSSVAVPMMIASAGDHATRRFLEFFAAQIRNKNTRMAYYRAACHNLIDKARSAKGPRDGLRNF